MKKTIATIIFAFILINVNAQAPDWAWAKSAVATGDATGLSSSTDATGNVYVTGTFGAPSIAFGTFTLMNSGNTDIFIVKYNPLGNILWAKGVGDAESDFSTAITTDGSGNVYITGHFKSPSITFGTTTLNNSGTGFNDIFIAKFDSLGNALWAKSAGNTDDDYGKSIISDSSGNVYVAGYYKSSITFGGTTLTTAGIDDIFVVKYDTSGNVLWANSAGGAYGDQALSIAADNSGNVYVTGSFYSPTFTFGTISLTNSSSGQDMFIAKIDAVGNLLWLNKFGGNNTELGQGIATDVSGNIYVTGLVTSQSVTSGSVTLISSGTNDFFLVKYDSLGNTIWAKNAVGTGNDFGTSAACDQDGNIYVTGYYRSVTLTFGTYTLVNGMGGGNFNLFIAKYDSSGNVIWAKGAGNQGANYGFGVSTDNSGNVYLTGSYILSITFGTTTFTSNGVYNMFIAKIDATTVNIEESIFQNGINIYPNPNNGICTIKSTDLKLQNCFIYNVLGECVFSQNSNLTNQINIDLSAQTKGIYFVEIFDENNSRINKKVIIE